MDVVLIQQDNVELEHQLMDVGNKLSNPPRLTHELLLLLDQAKKLLHQVNQSPKKTMLDALKPSMKVLIQDDLLRHSDVDVKVAVASCISQNYISTNLLTSESPLKTSYLLPTTSMKKLSSQKIGLNTDTRDSCLGPEDVFQLIVSSFEDLADQSSRSYIRRVLILETVSRVQSCVIMLDLECDGMIVEMFEHFLRSVRDYHRGVIYSSMENIMILVLEESEDISVEMLKPLLATVKKHNEGVLPIAQKLGEEVLKKSAEKLKPYLMPALTALGDSLDSYTEIVTRVCEGITAAMKRDDENDSGQQPEVKRPATIDLSSDSELKPQKQAGKKAVVTKEVKRPATIDSSGTSSKRKRKRKRTPVKDKDSDTIKYDERLVGKKVKVWWPEDKMYYEGVIESFDAAQEKHKVSYVGGNEENLYLKNQKWTIIQNFSAHEIRNLIL